MKLKFIFPLIMLLCIPVHSQVSSSTASGVRRVTFAQLAGAANGQIRRCTNCGITAGTGVCASGGSGAWAYGNGTAWICTAHLPAAAGGGEWGDITGTLADQTDLQTALDLKAPKASPTFTGTVVIPTPFTLGAVSVLPTGTELNFVDGVTSSIQTQLDAKAPLVSPSFTTPSLGVATATSINGNIFSSGTYTLTGAAGKTLTFNNSLTLAGTDGTTMTFPSTSATVARTDAANAFSGNQTVTSAANGGIPLTLKGTASQTGDLMQAFDTDGTSLRFRLSNNGLIGSRGIWIGAGFAGASGYDVIYFGQNSNGTDSWAYPNGILFRQGANMVTCWTADRNGIGNSCDSAFSRVSAGVIGVGTGAAGNSAGSLKVANYLTDTNCSDSAGAAACGSASAGSVVIDAGSTSVVVSTTAITANSQIFTQNDSSLGTRLSVTCNTQSSLVLGTPRVTARTAGTSFTVTIEVGPTTNPMCLNYRIVN